MKSMMSIVRGLSLLVLVISAHEVVYATGNVKQAEQEIAMPQSSKSSSNTSKKSLLEGLKLIRLATKAVGASSFVPCILLGTFSNKRAIVAFSGYTCVACLGTYVFTRVVIAALEEELEQ